MNKKIKENYTKSSRVSMDFLKNNSLYNLARSVNVDVCMCVCV